MVCDLEPSNYLKMNMNSPGIRTTIQNNTWVRIFPCHQKSIQHSHKPCGCTTIQAKAYMCSYANERVNKSVCVCVDWHTPSTLSSSIDASGIIETTIVNIFNNQKRGHSGAHTVLHTKYTKNYYAQFAACERIKCVCVPIYILNEPQARERWTIDIFNISLSHVPGDWGSSSFLLFLFSRCVICCAVFIRKSDNEVAHVPVVTITLHKNDPRCRIDAAARSLHTWFLSMYVLVYCMTQHNIRISFVQIAKLLKFETRYPLSL